MWRTPTGDRVLDPAEWAVFREGLVLLWDLIQDEWDVTNGLSRTGVTTFDDFQPGQKLSLLAEVGQALSDPAVPTPFHTAANEAAIAAVFAAVETYLDLELDTAEARTYLRELILQAAGDSDEDLPVVTSTDAEAWRFLLETLMFRVLWDVDFTQGTIFWTCRRTWPAVTWPSSGWTPTATPSSHPTGRGRADPSAAGWPGWPAVRDGRVQGPALEDRYHDWSSARATGPARP